METGGTVLILGSAPDAVRCRDWPKEQVSAIVALNNAWAVRPDWDDLVHPDDFPADRRPADLRAGQRLVTSADYVPANNAYGGVVYAGGTMAFSAGYWALKARRPRVMAFLGCDMIYPPGRATHFYGTGAPDPLRDDPTLRSLEAKSARLMLHAARAGTVCVRLSDGPSRLVFPSVGLDALPRVPAPDRRAGGARFEAAKAEEARLGYLVPSGRYWDSCGAFSAQAIDALDAMWLGAADGLAEITRTG